MARTLLIPHCFTERLSSQYEESEHKQRRHKLDAAQALVEDGPPPLYTILKLMAFSLRPLSLQVVEAQLWEMQSMAGPCLAADLRCWT